MTIPPLTSASVRMSRRWEVGSPWVLCAHNPPSPVYPPATKVNKLTDAAPLEQPLFCIRRGRRRRRPSSTDRRASGQTTTTMALSQSLAKSQIPAASTPFNRTTDRPTPRTRQARRKDLLAKKSVRFPLFTLPVRPPARLARQSIHLQLAKVSPAAAVHVRSPSVSLSLRCTRLSPDDVTRSCSSNTHAFAVPSPDDDEISQKSADLECGDLS